jgi:hypothetical protein
MLNADEAAEVLDKETYTPGPAPPKGQIPCYDPSTMQLLGHTKAMTPAEVSVPAAYAHVSSSSSTSSVGMHWRPQHHAAAGACQDCDTSRVTTRVTPKQMAHRLLQ